MNVYPSFRYQDADAALEFLQAAFGFEPAQVHRNDDDLIVHAEMRVGKGMIMFGDNRAGESQYGEHVGRGWTYVAIPDADALFAQAQAAGAEILSGLTDQDYGSRDFSAKDPEGNVWNFGTYEPE